MEYKVVPYLSKNSIHLTTKAGNQYLDGLNGCFCLISFSIRVEMTASFKGNPKTPVLVGFLDLPGVTPVEKSLKKEKRRKKEKKEEDKKKVVINLIIK